MSSLFPDGPIDRSKVARRLRKANKGEILAQLHISGVSSVRMLDALSSHYRVTLSHGRGRLDFYLGTLRWRDVDNMTRCRGDGLDSLIAEIRRRTHG